ERAVYNILNPTDSTLSLAEKIQNDVHGGGTDFNSIFRATDKKYDRIIILSDMQGWKDGYYHGGAPNQSFANYKKRIGANPFVYSFDLQGYGTLEFPENNVFCIAGWSEKILEVMKLLEEDRNALVNKIESYITL
ncbi:MAG: hypothetical protein WD512_05520, partial [Candidatus Paceibacterota bacterium]